jgi:hypothetical protein
VKYLEKKESRISEKREVLLGLVVFAGELGQYLFT